MDSYVQILSRFQTNNQKVPPLSLLSIKNSSGRYSFLLVFIMSKKYERLHTVDLNIKSQIFCFFHNDTQKGKSI
jgi:hypothetical protein